MSVICFVVYDLSIVGGVERVTEGLANRLMEEHEVHVLSIMGSNVNQALHFNDSVRVNFLNVEKARLRVQMMKAVGRLRKYFKKNQIEVAFLQSTYVGFIGAPLRFLSKAKIVFCDHGALQSQNGDSDIRKMRYIASKLCNTLVLLTEKTRKDYVDLFKIKRSKTEVIYNWINNSMINETREYDLKSKMILTAGRFMKEKGFDLLVQVAKRVMPECKGWKWYVFGEGQLEEQIRNDIAENGLTDFVVLNGFTSKMNEVYEKTAIYVLSSYREGIPLVLLEAKAFKIPCISFDIVTGPNEIIEDGKNGVLIKPYDVDGMASAIIELINNDNMRKQYSDNAYSNIEKFSEENVLNQWNSLIARITHAGK